jgi:ABC-type polysaccharide/polyol phosphate export permease
LLVGTLAGDFYGWGALAALPLVFGGALLFSALGMCVAALARNFNDLSNAQFYVVFPCFLLAGVLFPLDALPPTAAALAWLLPLTPLLDLLRALVVGTQSAPWAGAALMLWTTVAVVAAARAVTWRLVK